MQMSKGKRNIVLTILGILGGLMYLIPYIRYSFYDQMMEALSLNDAQLGTIGLVYGLGNMVCYLFSGWLADRYTPRTLILIGTGGMALTTFWYALLPGYGSMLIIHALYSVFSVGMWWCPYLKAVRQLFPENLQGTAYGLGESIRGIAQAIVAFIGLSAMTAAVNAAAGFRGVVLTNAIAFAIMFFGVLFLYPKEGGEANKKASLKESILVMLGYLKMPATWIVIFIIMSGYTVWTTASNFLGTYCTRVLNMPDTMSSLVSILRNYVLVFAAGAIGGVVLDKFRKRGNGLMVFFAVTLVSTLALFVTQNTVVVGVAITLITAFAVNAIISTYWSSCGPAGFTVEQTGGATGVISLIAFTTDMFTPPVVGNMIQRGEDTGNVIGGFNNMLIWLVVWSILGIVASWLLTKRQTKLEAAAKSE